MRTHRRRSRVGEGRGLVIVVVGSVGLTLALLAAAFGLKSTSGQTALPSEDPPVTALPDAAALESSLLPADMAAMPQPPNYRYSVVAGGVHSTADVTNAVRRDPVVRAHYAGVSLSSLRMTQTPARREAYMSYRIGDRVYWTSRKIVLAEGEAVITDGVTTIRARCGNLFADEAMAPVSADEPPLSAFEATEPSSVVAGTSEIRPLASSGFVPAGAPGVPGVAMSSLPSATFAIGGAAGFVPGSGLGAVVAPGSGQTSRNPSADGIGTLLAGPDVLSESPDGDTPSAFVNPLADPPGFDPPGIGDEPFPGPDGPNPDGPNPDFPPLGGDDPTVDLHTPPEVVPVPEPGTFVLLGSGLALVAWRARQKSRHNRPGSQ
jgi:hypothetical protein